MPVEASISPPKDVELEGLQDGGHIYVKCSNCRAILMDIWRTRPHETETWKVKATCPFCGDESFETPIQGGFHFGGYGKMINETEDIPSTIVGKFDIDGDTFQFEILKAKDGQPLYQ